MSLAAEKLAEALALPKADRALLARELIASLDDKHDEGAEMEWREVIDRRTHEMENGKVSNRSTEEVLKGIRAKLNANREAS